MVVITVTGIAACDGQSDVLAPLVAGNNGADPDAAGEQIAEQVEDTVAEDELANDQSFDIAELFFTEVDRQWFCSVTTPVSVFTDQFSIERTGAAQFDRFGVAQWSRQKTPDQLNFKTALGSTFVAREIFGTNTILEFERFSEREPEELYECVLTTRELSDL